MGMRPRPILSVRLAIGWFLLTFLCGCQNPFSQPPLVGIILWNQDMQSYDEILQGAIEGLREEGYLDGLNLRLEVTNATGDRGRAAGAVSKLKEQGARLIITLGTISTLVALDVLQGSSLPVVYSGVGAPAAAGLDDKFAAGRATGASMEVPVAEQLKFLILARPGLQRLGILLCTATPPAVATGHAAEAAAREMGLRVVKATVTDERPELLEKALTTLENKKVEALFLSTDPVLAAPRNLKVISARMLKARVPLMTPFASSITHGVLISYHADLVEVGRQAGRQAGRILSGASVREVPPEIPRVKRLTLNLRAAESLGLPLTRQLLSRAHNLH
jgi:putative ABC transport system substrate-binding protein